MSYSELAAQSPLEISRMQEPVILDGIPDESSWENIKPVSLVSHWPTFGNPVEDGLTEIRIGYDEDYLYVSCRCYGDPENISAPTYKRDMVQMNMDGVSLMLDTYNDNENGLWFTVTPNGSRADIAVRNDATGDEPINVYWDTIWEAEARISETGWTMELRIPFSSLRYETANNTVQMGLSVYRYSAHNVSLITFPAIPANWGFWSAMKPSQYQQVVFEDIPEHTPFYLTPYLLGGVERTSFLAAESESYQHANDLTYEAGFDAKLGLTNNITLDLTANTDFAQVEADNQQLNLTRFSLFFPERRRFFLEREAVFEFSFGEMDRLFYSRRIGLSDDGLPLRILGGARMIARSGGWDVGLLSMQTARDLGLPSENHSVLRFRKQLFNPQSYAGGMMTGRFDEKGNYNASYGMDGIFNFSEDDFLKINVAHSADSEINKNPFYQDATRIRTEWERRTFSGLNFNLNFNYSGQSYDPGMGFQLRRNYFRFGDRISYGWQPDENAALQRGQLSMNGSIYLRNEDSSLESSEFGPSVQLTWKRGDFAVAGLQWITEDIVEPFSLGEDVEVLPGLYNYPEAELSYETPRGEGLRSQFIVSGGGFFDGNRITISAQPEWSVSSVMQLDLFYQYNRIRFPKRKQELNAHIGRFRTEFTFNTKFTLSSFIQYSSTDHLGIMNVRFRYNPRDGNDLYLVLNETLNANRNRELPALPLSQYRAILLKYNYTFRF